jgi:hypothetical protein
VMTNAEILTGLVVAAVITLVVIYILENRR